MTPRTIRLQPRDRRVLTLLEERGPLTRHVLHVDCFPNIGDARVRNRLSELSRAGFLLSSGEGREALYMLPPDRSPRSSVRPIPSQRRIALHARDLAVLELLVERRAETLTHLHECFWPAGRRKSARNRLGELQSAGYLGVERMPVPGSEGRLESIYTLGPKAKAALILRGRGDPFHGRRFNPTLRTDSLPHQIATNRVVDWLGARLVPEHLLPVRSRAALQHRPDGVYEAARPDAKGRDLVFLEVDLGSYSRERMLGKVAAFRASDRARSILIVTPTPERAQLVTEWVRDAYGPAALDEVQALSFEEVKAGMVDPGTEPLARHLVATERQQSPA